MSCRVISLGHSTHTIDRLTELCRGTGIEVVADIRRFPRSRRNPHLGKASLERELPVRGIGYAWLGSELGGFRDAGYEAWTTTDDFVRGITILEELALSRIVGFMCSEGVPDRCHRRFVARVLQSRGHHVSHLLPDGRMRAEDARLELPDR